MSNIFIFTSESVTKGHLTKFCDQISDGILDAMLEQGSMSRVACETTCTTGQVLIMVRSPPMHRWTFPPLPARSFATSWLRLINVAERSF